MNWNHPTSNAPKNVVLVCLGASRNSYIEKAMEREPPDWMLQADEIWTLNRGALVLRHHLAFVLDYLDGEAAHFPGYGALLHRHDRPIITSHAAGWPGHVYEYPFPAIWNWLMSEIKPNHQEWLINSVPMIAIYAAWIGVKNLAIFGADYQGHSQREDGHACLAYWTGVLERHGMTVHSPDSSQFLGMNARFVYGYHPDQDPRPDAVARRQRFQQLIKGTPSCDLSNTTASNGRSPD